MEVAINSIHLRYEVHGVGVPVLLVHGFPLSGALWEPVSERLRDGFRLIVPDLHGHGGSDASDEAGMEHYAADLAALLDEIGEARPVVLVGHSMGGYVAFEFHRRYPDKLRALVLVNTRVEPDSELAAQARYDTADKVMRQGTEFLADQMAQKLFAAQAADAFRRRWRDIMAATPQRGAAVALRAMARRPDSSDTLRTMDRPVLIIAGQEDAIIPVAEAEDMHELAQSSKLEVIPGAGHMAPVEKPAEFAASLRRFLDDLGQ